MSSELSQQFGDGFPSGSLEERILSGLDEEQLRVATTLNGPLCVLAGAGTGKTRAITHRIAYGVSTGVYNPNRLLAVTFTARAAAEMRTRLRDLGVGQVQARTFHAAALRQLQYFWPHAVGGQLPGLLEHKAQLIAAAASRLRLPTDRAAVRDLASEIEWAKVSMLTPETYLTHAADRGEPAGLDKLAVSRLFQSYEDVKGQRNQIDFEDVLLITVGILQEDARVAATVREQYRHFVVDEYQDVSPLQQRLLDLWLGGRDEICVVGDASQTIYSFTGATPAHLLEFKSRYPEANVVNLVRDYRSTPQVVALANGLLNNRRSGGFAADARWSKPLELRAQRPSGQPAEFFEASDDEAESIAVAERIKKLLAEGVQASEIAVLFRTNGQSEAYERALSAANIGYQLRGGERFFARKEVRDAILQMRAASRAAGEDPLGQLVRDILGNLGYQSEAPTSGGAVRERWESLRALVDLADELAQSRTTEDHVFSLADFVAELQERATAQHAPTVQGVTLASLHSAKGLEWDAVFLVGLSEGLMPISFADSPETIDEERRLLYVGITRAREFLSFSWSTSRTPGGRASRKPSRFLDGLRPGTIAGQSNLRAVETKRQRKTATPVVCRVCGKTVVTGAERKLGRCSSCPATYDENMFEDLRAWRLEEATSAEVPAFVVFTDATLMAIAEAEPADLDALAALPGVGPSKLERYGVAVLEIVANA